MCLLNTDTNLYKLGYKLIIENGCKEVFEFLEKQNKKKSEKLKKSLFFRTHLKGDFS